MVVFLKCCYVLYSVSANSFSSGHSFIYHKEIVEIYGDDALHDSYTSRDLFIESGKYSSLKEEILSNIDNARCGKMSRRDLFVSYECIWNIF